MKNQKKLTILLGSIFGALVLTLGITFAVFTYQQTGTSNNQLVLGDIYMHYNETNQLKMENAMPASGLNVMAIYKPNPVMQTEESGTGILGKCESYFADENFDEGTTATSFCRGSGTSNGKTLLELSDDNDMVKNVLLSYELIMPKIDLPYFEFTISGKNTYSKKDIYYDVVLNHGDAPENRNTRIEDKFLKFSLFELNEDKTETEIFINKAFSNLENKRIHVETIPKNTMVEINKTYRLYMWIYENVVIGNVGEDYTTEEWKDVFASIKVNVTGDFLEKELDYEDKYTITDASCFTTTIENNEVVITDYDAGCGSDVVIPEIIDGYKVSVIGNCNTNIVTQLRTNDNNKNVFNNLNYQKNNNSNITQIVAACGRFADKYITSIKIPNSVTTIESESIMNNLLTSIEIPNSVITIGYRAFSSNRLTSVIFEDNSSLDYIDLNAFVGENHTITEVTIPDSVTHLDCYAFNDDVIINKRDDLELSNCK